MDEHVNNGHAGAYSTHQENQQHGGENITTDAGISPEMLLKMKAKYTFDEEGLSPEESLQRRTRLNRLLMKRRRLDRTRTSSRRLASLGIGILIAVLVITSLCLSGSGAAYSYYQTQLPHLNGIANHTLFQTTHIYDRNGKLLYDLYNHADGYGRRTYVDYKDISPALINATVAAEDHTFWQNDGVDFQGIARAAFLDFRNQSVVGGGSTITQQVIKNQLFVSKNGNFVQRNLQVKAQEAVLAYGLTQQYPKWKIMEMYLNTVYYGNLNYGVEAAAQDYFNLHPKCRDQKCIPAVAQLDLAQSSLLAGLPQGPSLYNPAEPSHLSNALARQKVVLQAMVDLNMITKARARSAEAETAKFSFKSTSNQSTMQAPHFVQYVMDDVLVPMLGAQNLLNGGYSIYTTLDLDLEKKVEQIAYQHLYTPEYDPYQGAVMPPLSSNNNVNNAAAVVMNPRSGEILAMNGSADYKQNTPQLRGQDNVALALRQPGSSFKPIVYATAFEMGWYPAMIIPDHRTYFPSQGPNYYAPNNYDLQFHTGFPMTVRMALANSFNVPAVDAIEFAGIPNVLNMAGRLGLSEVAQMKPSQNGPSMALGTARASLLHMTSAYATFANQGVHVNPTSILQITDGSGNTLYKYDTAHPKGRQAIRPDIAYLMDSILSDKAARYREFGQNNPLELADRPVAAKTGTTENYQDNLTIGYTPYLTVGVWAGNSDNTPMNHVIGITGAGPIWHDVMEYASQRYHFPPADFVRPADVHQQTVSATSGLAPQPGEATVSDWFIDGTSPTIGGASYIQPQPVCTDQCGGQGGDNQGGGNQSGGGGNHKKK